MSCYWLLSVLYCTIQCQWMGDDCTKMIHTKKLRVCNSFLPVELQQDHKLFPHQTLASAKQASMLSMSELSSWIHIWYRLKSLRLSILRCYGRRHFVFWSSRNTSRDKCHFSVRRLADEAENVTWSLIDPADFHLGNLFTFSLWLLISACRTEMAEYNYVKSGKLKLKGSSHKK